MHIFAVINIFVHCGIWIWQNQTGDIRWDQNQQHQEMQEVRGSGVSD